MLDLNRDRLITIWKDSGSSCESNFQTFQLTDRRDLHVRRVGHKEVPVEISRPRSRACSHPHDGVERDRARNVLHDVRHQPLAVDVRLEIRVLVHLAAGQPRNLSDRRQIDVRVVEHEQVDGATGVDAILSQVVVGSRLGSWRK